jgi:pimeloyl-ACP methyl ester carboxylesterase
MHQAEARRHPPFARKKAYPLQIIALMSILLSLVVACGSQAPIGSGMVSIGDYGLYITCQGEGEPTVILESGLGETTDNWSLVQPQVAEFSRVCTYDRAGLGQSDPGPTPRTSRTVVDELRALLERAHVQGPYVLAGHSIGGLHALLFAYEYPQEVAGLVLVDSSHYDSFWRMEGALPPETPDENEAVHNWRMMMRAVMMDPMFNPEGLDLPQTNAQLRFRGSLGDFPLVVLTAGNKQRPDFPPEMHARLEAEWLELQKDLAALSSAGRHVVAQESGHYIQKDQPDLVVDAIRQIVEAVRE